MTDLRSLGDRAALEVPPGAAVGLGTGAAATAFIRALADRVRAGLTVRGVPTSEASANLARELGIPLVALADAGELDVAVDGADEVDPAGNLIKGYGGALVREKIVAASARRFVVVVGAEKLVPVLGSRGKLPVEVVPFAVPLVTRRLVALGLTPKLRLDDGDPFATDNGNPILDAAVGPLPDPAGLDRDLLAIPGVVGTGLFVGVTDLILIQHPDGTIEERRPAR